MSGFDPNRHKVVAVVDMPAGTEVKGQHLHVSLLDLRQAVPTALVAPVANPSTNEELGKTTAMLRTEIAAAVTAEGQRRSAAINAAQAQLMPQIATNSGAGTDSKIAGALQTIQKMQDEIDILKRSLTEVRVTTRRYLEAVQALRNEEPQGMIPHPSNPENFVPQYPLLAKYVLSINGDVSSVQDFHDAAAAVIQRASSDAYVLASLE